MILNITFIPLTRQSSREGGETPKAPSKSSHLIRQFLYDWVNRQVNHNSAKTNPIAAIPAITKPNLAASNGGVWITAAPVNVAEGLAVVTVATSLFGFVEIVTIFVLVRLGKITVLLLTNGGMVKLVEVIVVVFIGGGIVVVKFRVLVTLIWVGATVMKAEELLEVLVEIVGRTTAAMLGQRLVIKVLASI